MQKTSRGSGKYSDDRDQDAKGSERSWQQNTTVDIWIKSCFGDIFTKASSEDCSQNDADKKQKCRGKLPGLCLMVS